MDKIERHDAKWNNQGIGGQIVYVSTFMINLKIVKHRRRIQNGGGCFNQRVQNISYISDYIIEIVKVSAIVHNN
jgi:hypothetical protein